MLAVSKATEGFATQKPTNCKDFSCFAEGSYLADHHFSVFNVRLLHVIGETSMDDRHEQFILTVNLSAITHVRREMYGKSWHILKDLSDCFQCFLQYRENLIFP